MFVSKLPRHSCNEQPSFTCCDHKNAVLSNHLSRLHCGSNGIYLWLITQYKNPSSAVPRRSSVNFPRGPIMHVIRMDFRRVYGILVLVNISLVTSKVSSGV